MPTTRVIHIQPSDDDTLAQGVADIQRELRLPLAFPPEVEAAAAQAAANPRLPDLDRTDIPLVTIDPPGALDVWVPPVDTEDWPGFVVAIDGQVRAAADPLGAWWEWRTALPADAS